MCIVNIMLILSFLKVIKKDSNDHYTNLMYICKVEYVTFIFLSLYSETRNNEYIERIHQMSYSSLSDNGMLQIFSFLFK